MKARVSITVNRPVTEVFDHVADRRNEVRWSAYATRIEKVSPGPIGPGTRFHGHYKMFGELDIEIVEYERPRYLVYRSRTSAVDYRMSFSVEPTADGARLALIGEETFKGSALLLVPVMYLMRRPIFRSFVRGIKRALEEEAPSSGGGGRSEAAPHASS